jgi:hypothetical protein
LGLIRLLNLIYTFLPVMDAPELQGVKEAPFTYFNLAELGGNILNHEWGHTMGIMP